MEIDRRDFLKMAPVAAAGGLLGFIFGQSANIKINIARYDVAPDPKELSPLGFQSAKSLQEFLTVFDRTFNWLDRAGLTARLPNKPENYFIDVFSIDTSVYRPINSSVHMQRGLHLDGIPYRKIEFTEEGRETFHEQFLGTDITSMREITANRWREITEHLNLHFERYAEVHNSSMVTRREYTKQLQDRSPRLPTLNT